MVAHSDAGVQEGVQREGWFDLSTLREPYRVEGKKTMGYELAEQLEWALPDVIIYPTGGGTGLIGMWKAFDELEALGLIGSRRPRMVSVQSTGCAPIVRAFEQGVEQAALGHCHGALRHPVFIEHTQRVHTGLLSIVRLSRNAGRLRLTIDDSGSSRTEPTV